MKMPKLKFALPKFRKSKAGSGDDPDAVADEAVLAKAPKDDGAGEAKPKGLKRLLPRFKGRAKDDPDRPGGQGRPDEGCEGPRGRRGQTQGAQALPPQVQGQGQGDAEDDTAVAQALEDDETSEDKRGGKGFLPKLRGKARVLVPVAAALVLAAGGGGGFYVWRMMKAAPAGETQAAAPEGGAADKAVQKAEAGERKPEEAGAKPSVEAHAESGKEASAAAEHGENKAEGAEKGGQESGGQESGGHEAGGHGKEKLVITPLPPPPPPSEIVTMAWHLQDLQERIATGDSAAFEEMPKHLRALGHKIFDAPPQTWENKDNTHALISYLLRGGSPGAGRKALASPKFHAPDLPVAKAAVAYIEGVEGPDRDVMLTLDPMALDAALGASVAFVQSVLLTPRDHERAIAKLDVARLLAPGGLVEEAALRREVGLLADERQYERFASLGRQYWARFRASPYAENFLRQFMLGVARVSLSIKLSEWSQLNDFVESLTQETKLKIYLTVAENASVVGNVELAAMAAQRARDLSPEDSRERQRASLYVALAAVGSADPARSAHLLDGVDRAQLPPGDQPLYDAAAHVSGRIYRAPEKDFKQAPPGDPDAVDADFDRAENLLAQGDEAIASVRKTMARKGL